MICDSCVPRVAEYSVDEMPASDASLLIAAQGAGASPFRFLAGLILVLLTVLLQFGPAPAPAPRPEAHG